MQKIKPFLWFNDDAEEAVEALGALLEAGEEAG